MYTHMYMYIYIYIYIYVYASIYIYIYICVRAVVDAADAGDGAGAVLLAGVADGLKFIYLYM